MQLKTLHHWPWSRARRSEIIAASGGVPFHPPQLIGRPALGLKDSVERAVVALQERRHVAEGRSLVYEAIPKRDLVAVTLGGRPKRTPRFLAASCPVLVP
jgi:hypothetical protein